MFEVAVVVVVVFIQERRTIRVHDEEVRPLVRLLRAAVPCWHNL